MQNAMTDLNPEFASGGLMTFLAEEDLSRNLYDCARGPCCDKKKWWDSSDHQVFISIDDLEGYADTALLIASGEEGYDDDDEDDDLAIGENWDEPATVNPDTSHREVNEDEITLWLHERYSTYMRGASAKAYYRRGAKGELDRQEQRDGLQELSAFPCMIGARKAVEVVYHKICQVKRLCRSEESPESHGKHGRKKQFKWSGVAAGNSNRRENTLKLHMIPPDVVGEELTATIA